MSRKVFAASVALLLAITLAWLAAESAAQEGGGSQEKIDVLIVTGFDVGAHKWRETTPLTKETLEKTERMDVRVVEDIGIFESSSLSKYDVVVLNYGFWTAPDPSDEGKENLLRYVRDGGGLVSLHFSCSAFQEWKEYADLLGRVWKKGVGGHGPRGKFTVKIAKPDHPITRGLESFEIDDELYAKLSGDAEIEVLASADSEWSGKTEPIVFVKRHGKGRVAHNVLGHDVRAREHPTARELVSRCVEWAATGKVAAR